MNKTTSYYNANAQFFHAETAHLDLSNLYAPFLKHVKSSGHILDAGCGSGRDTRYFKSQGYQVTAFDASMELCKLASETVGQEVLHLEFENMQFENIFDGVWACASLLHVPKNNLPEVFYKIAKSLKDQGVAYCSFKLGNSECERNGRHFTDLNTETLLPLIRPSNLILKDHWITNDIRPDRSDEKWLNALLIKN